jgi:serine-type D-Ala-D-Ala carboxypeptidase (penicillin-binding protein 5/6)
VGLSTKRLKLAVVSAVLAGLVAWVGISPPDIRHAALTAVAAQGRPAPPDVTCAACILTTEGGRVLFGRAQRQPRANASTTKMITALVVVGATDLDAVVPVSATAAATGGGGLDLQSGDELSVRDLLYALLLSSSNDAAVALAEHVAGSEAAFVAMMNEAARRLGASESSFVTAHGLDTPNHYSTARDLAVIGAAVLDHRVLRSIVATPSTVIEGRSGPVEVENRNLLLESYRGALGIKTGYTAQAGNVLVAAARRRQRTIIAVAMGSADATEDARRLLDYGWARLARTILVEAGTQVGVLVLPSGRSTPVIAAGDVRGFAARRQVAVHYEPDATAGSPVAGQPVGTVEVTAGERSMGTTDAIAADGVGTDPSWAAGMLGAILKTAAGVTGRL